MGSCLKNYMPSLGEDSEFFGDGSKRARSAQRHSSTVGGEVSRSQHHQPSDSNWSGIHMLVGGTIINH